MSQQLDEAFSYTGSIPMSGLMQLGLLTRSGLSKTDNVLEIGCGTLQAAKAIIPSVALYCGIDPNEWLRQSFIVSEGEMHRIIEKYRPRFASNDDFDGRVFGVKFQHILAASVLSHAATWQMELLLRNAAAVLTDTGVLTASVRLGPDTNSSTWVYPGVAFFQKETLEAAASRFGLVATHEPEYRSWVESYRSIEYNDWFTFRKKR